MQDQRKGFRRGTHRLECDCGAVIYSTVPNLERHGLPRCGCGATFIPDSVELAALLGLDDAPAMVEYMHELRSVDRGQAGPARAAGNGGAHFRKPQQIAWERVEKRRREQARANRLNALRPVAAAMPF